LLSEKLVKALNDQMAQEFGAANLYLSMAAYCEEEGYAGFSNFFLAQVEEERFHAMKFYHYLNELGERAVISGLPNPEQDFGTVQGAFEAALEHEKLVTKLINDLADLAEAEKHRPTINFLQWFIDEQVEEEASFNEILDKFKMIGESGAALYHLDKELGTRTFVPPAPEA